jgi:hypothetical protein
MSTPENGRARFNIRGLRAELLRLLDLEIQVRLPGGVRAMSLRETLMLGLDADTTGNGGEDPE